MSASLEAVPCEVLVHILSTLPGPSLAAAGATCRAAHAVARCEDMWKSAYRRDFGCDFPPAAHIDFASHGKDARWLYALAAVPAGRIWREPNTRRLCARIVSGDGSIVMSGECCLVTDPTTGKARLRLDGYGAHVTANGVVREGLWCEGVFTGPGRIFRPLGTDGADYVGTSRCQRFDADMRAQGRGSEHLDDHAYEGSFLNDKRDGFGIYRWPDGDVAWAEWARGRRCGRMFHVEAGPGGQTFSGQMRADAPSVVTKRGVKRTRHGNLQEGRWNNDVDAWKIMRFSACQSGKEMSVGGASVATRADGSVRRSRGAGYRIDTPSGGVAIGDHGGPVFVAVSDACADPRLAGRRFFPGLDGARAWTTIASSSSPGSDDNKGSCPVPSDPWSPLGRAFALYLSQPDCALRRRKSLSAAVQARMASTDARAGATITVDEGTADGCIGVPFGRPVTTGPGPDQRPMIRCFLTGGLVAATECRVLSNGRAYEANALAVWRACAIVQSTDPETGHELLAPDTTLSWRAWMAEIRAPPDLAWAIAHASRSPGCNTDTVHDLARLGAARLTRAADMTRAATGGVLRDLLAGPVNVARDEDGPLVRGFDGAVMTCIELRHPDWDPRGPWRLGTPDCTLPEDTTVGDHERPDAAPLDHLESHGIARAALESPSFLGAHLEGVFFFGHALCGACFAGARLVGCAFVGCRFERCVFADALLVRCHFDECTLGDGTAVDTDAALAAIRKDGML